MKTDLLQLEALSKWLADDNEVPSIGDVACVLDAIEEIEALRKDAERMDWLESEGHGLLWTNDGEKLCIRAADGAEGRAETWREAIDICMKTPRE
jgi:hypothetical protein